MLRDGSNMVLTLMICLSDRNSVLLNPPKKRKVVAKSSGDEATSSHAKNVSLLRKTQRFPSAEKTQLGSISSSSARSNISLVQMAGRLVVLVVLGMFYSSLMLTSLKTMICSME